MVESSSNTHNLPVAMLNFCLNELCSTCTYFPHFISATQRVRQITTDQVVTIPTEVQQQQQQPQLQTPIVAQVLIRSCFYHFLFDKEKYSVSYIYWQNSKSPIFTVSLYLQHQTLVYCLFIKE